MNFKEYLRLISLGAAAVGSVYKGVKSIAEDFTSEDVAKGLAIAGAGLVIVGGITVCLFAADESGATKNFISIDPSDFGGGDFIGSAIDSIGSGVEMFSAANTNDFGTYDDSNTETFKAEHCTDF